MEPSLFDEPVDEVDEIVRMLQGSTFIDHGKTVHWPADDAVDRALVLHYLEKWSPEDLKAEIRSWIGWKKANPPQDRKKRRPRSDFQGWVSRTERRRGQRGAGPNQRGHAGVRGADRRPSVFGAPGQFAEDRGGLVKF